MYQQTFNTIAAKLYDEFRQQNYKYFVHRHLHRHTGGHKDRQADSSISPKTFVLRRYNERISPQIATSAAFLSSINCCISSLEGLVAINSSNAVS